MSDPAELLQWHDEERQRSDESFLIGERKFSLVDRRPAPLDLSAQEQLDFLSEYCDGYQHVAKTPLTPAVFILWGEGFQTTRARTLSDAICLAAAKWKEMNE